MMCKSLVVLAVLAVTAPSLAFAGETPQQKKSTGPAINATQMSDAEMDKVTAGTAGGALLTVAPSGLVNAPNPPTTPLVFGTGEGAGQATGGHPGDTLPVIRGVATFSAKP